MKKRAKSDFRSQGSFKSVLFALLILAAAITVYGIANAAVVSHTPNAIQPQGAGSGLDSDLLQGLSSADYLNRIENLRTRVTNLEATAGAVTVVQGTICPADKILLAKYWDSTSCGGIRNWCSNACTTGARWVLAGLSAPTCPYNVDNQMGGCTANTCTAQLWSRVLCAGN